MNKSKVIAATITTLVLFAIVRMFTPSEPPVAEPDKVIEEVESEDRDSMDEDDPAGADDASVELKTFKTVAQSIKPKASPIKKKILV